MKGKDKGIYWVKVEAKEGWETETSIYPKGFTLALGDKKTFDELVKSKVVKQVDTPSNVAKIKNPKRIFKTKK